jgi:hypothetical protein
MVKPHQMSATLDLSVEEFAKWLVERAPERLWSVDDEDHIQQALSLPCTGAELAEELEKRRGRLRFLGPQQPSARPRLDLGRLSPVAYGDGDEIIFRVAWLNGDNQGPPWFIETDLLAEEATRSAHAS